MNLKKIIILAFSIFIIGCSSDGVEDDDFTETEDSELIDSTYDEETYRLNSYSIASLESGDPEYLNPPPKLNSWGITTIGNSRTEIALKLHTKNPIVNFNDQSLWALFIRTTSDPSGIVSFDELEVKLFYEHNENKDVCCVNTLPFNAFDLAEESYIPVGGYVNFESESKGMFSLDFQREEEVGNGVMIGQAVNINGCWNISWEFGVSGCSL